MVAVGPVSGTGAAATPAGARPVIVLYDGHCRLCVASSRRLARWARPGAVELSDFQRPGALAAFPQVSYEECQQALILIAADGRVRRAADAVATVLGTRRGFGWVPRLYARPFVSRCAEALYAWIARHRYLFGRASACEDGGCALRHAPGRRGA